MRRKRHVTFREPDVVGRLGGDEFAALVTNAGGDELQQLLSRLQKQVDQYNRDAQRGYDISYSVGAVGFDASRHDDVLQLMAEADGLMYAQKAKRRSQADRPAPLVSNPQVSTAA